MVFSNRVLLLRISYITITEFLTHNILTWWIKEWQSVIYFDLWFGLIFILSCRTTVSVRPPTILRLSLLLLLSSARGDLQVIYTSFQQHPANVKAAIIFTTAASTCESGIAAPIKLLPAINAAKNAKMP